MSATNSRAAAIRVFGLSDEDLEAWRSSGLGDWLIDRVARRPSGSRGHSDGPWQPYEWIAAIRALSHVLGKT